MVLNLVVGALEFILAVITCLKNILSPNKLSLGDLVCLLRTSTEDISFLELVALLQQGYL